MKFSYNSSEGTWKDFDIETFKKLLERRKTESEKNNLQPTIHQQDAIDTAKIFSDFKSLGIYMRIFKYNSLDRYTLLACRDWVLSRTNCLNKGRLFVSVYRKFLGFSKK